MNNILIKGDNIKGLQYLLEKKKLKNSIDLVYIDPPFATNNNFTITNGRASTISNSKKGAIAYSDKIQGIDFLNFLEERLLLINELLSDKGSIYLHIDYKIGHYVKILMDDIFGIDNFRSDITRIKCNPKNFKRIGYGNVKDMILFYSKGSQPIWNEPLIGYTDADIERLYPKKDKQGRRYTTVPLHAPGETLNSKLFKGLSAPEGRHWRTDVNIMDQWDKEGLIEWSSKGNPRKIIYSDERQGKRAQDVWLDYKDPAYPVYPTEKNIDLLNLIISTSSNKDSIVLDCFCGSGTTLKAASINGRTWIGIDESDLALEQVSIKLDLDRNSLFGNNLEYIDLE